MIDDKGKSIQLETKDKQQSLSLDESGKKVVLKVGSSASLEMNAQGDVALTGTKSVTVKAAQVKVEADASLTMQSGGMLEIKANGILSLKGSMVKIN
ncbi:hypothetical protein D3C80_1329480 [compost metagenome]